MRIGSFFSILLVTIIAMGYLLSDNIHLREEISRLHDEINKLEQALQQVEQEKQQTLMDLQSTSNQLQSCQQQVGQSDQAINALEKRNKQLEAENQSLQAAISSSDALCALPETSSKVARLAQFSPIVLIILLFGSLMAVGLKSLQGQRNETKRACYDNGGGTYVYLTKQEVKELIEWRRRTGSFQA